MSLTAHCVIKNEEKWISYAIRSVIDYVDTVLIFDTGSTDSTVTTVSQLQAAYPGKIIFEEKGPADKIRHTTLRQEMIERTTTDWFMILDGDEVWTKRGIEEIKQQISSPNEKICFIVPFYLCVGDVYHHSRRGQFTQQGKKIHATARLFKKIPGLHWSGAYGSDTVLDSRGTDFTKSSQVGFLKARFWHLTHLQRSTTAEDYSSGSLRKFKVVPTYFLVGKKITEPIPEVFVGKATPLSAIKSFIQFWPFVISLAAKLGTRYV